MSEQTVALLEADPDTAEAIRALLQAEGYGVVSGADVAALREASSRSACDIAVVDAPLNAGELSSICEKLREAPWPTDLPVLLLSHAGHVGAHRAALNAGVDDFLMKPVHGAELVLRIRGLLLLRSVQRDLTESNDLLRHERDALVRLQRQKDSLIEMIVHDLKNPLASIATNASFLGQASEMDDDVRQCAASIDRAAENLLRMVHNMLDVFRGDETGLSPVLVRLSLGELLREAVEITRRRAHERQAEVELCLPDEEVVLEADRDLLRRVIENLLDNALRYTPKRGRVRVGLELGDARVLLFVEDDGPGIPEGDRERVFERYERLDREADRSAGRRGRGLGLAFVQLVAQAHGGSARACAGKLQGARLEVELPRRPG